MSEPANPADDAVPPAPQETPVGDPKRATYLDGLSAKQEQAIYALLVEPTLAKAAEKVGVNERTLYRWLDDPKFNAAFRAARRDAFAHAIALTHRYAPMAVQALAKIMTDPSCPASARVSAANGILNFARESIELDDLAERVKALEQAAAPPPATHAMPPAAPPARPMSEAA